MLTLPEMTEEEIRAIVAGLEMFQRKQRRELASARNSGRPTYMVAVLKSMEPTLSVTAKVAAFVARKDMP